MLLDYSLLLRRHGQAAEAIAQYKEVLRIAPDDAKTYVEMATAYRTLNQVPQALQSMRKHSSWIRTGLWPEIPAGNTDFSWCKMART